MRAIMLMFDSLRKDMLGCYGNKENITPNFQRVANKCVKFDNCFVGSMPCMPARRELQTGRYNFMHRSWGPMEPFDNSAPELLRKQGIYTHLVTDHKHYWREGGATYHPKFSSYEFVRGQEGDAWKGEVLRTEVECSFDEPKRIREFKKNSRSQDMINRKYMRTEEEHPMSRTVKKGIEFIETNIHEDQWFLQIECFDPHEPFFVPDKYLKMYGVEEEFNGWPPYYFNTLDASLTKTIQNYYRALVTMCDVYVGKVLDVMDANNMWEDTVLIVATDHGFLLGEHDWWGKNIMPLYNEIANIPFFIHHPTLTKGGETCHELIQNIDVAPTLYDCFDISTPSEVKGKSLLKIIHNEDKHEEILFGYFGSNINICDGEYVYMRAPIASQDITMYEYTLMPTHINHMFSIEELKNLSLAEPFDFTKGVKTMRIPVRRDQTNYQRFSDRLYALHDHQQHNKLENIEVEYRLLKKMVKIMRENDAPEELYEYYGLNGLSFELLRQQREESKKYHQSLFGDMRFSSAEAREGFITFCNWMNFDKEAIVGLSIASPIDEAMVCQFVQKYVPLEHIDEVLYQVQLNMRLN